MSAPDAASGAAPAPRGAAIANPHLSRVVLRPRGPLEIFDLSLRLIRAHPGTFGRLWGLSVGLAMPVAALTFALGQAGWYLLLGLPLVFPFAAAPASVLAGRLLFSASADLRGVGRELRAHVGRLVLAGVLQALGVLGGLACFGIGAVLAVPATLFATESALLEKVRVARVLRRCSRLASLNLGNALAGTIGWAVLTGWGAIAGEATGQAVVGFVFQLGQPLGAWATGDPTPYMVLGMFAVQPLFGVYRLLLYVDTRTRVEGWDLQVGLRAAGLGGS